MTLKGFRINDETLKRYEELKQKEKISSDVDFFSRMLDYAEKGQDQDNKEKNSIPIEVLEAKDKELKALYIKLGELQGELNIYKQKALPKKSFWRRLFGD